MIHIKYLAVIAILSLALVGCSSFNKQNSSKDPNELYAIAQQKLRNYNWKQAIAQLEALDNSYPIGPYSQQVQLDLIYAYYKNADLLLAQNLINRFMHLNPTHPNIDYVLYMRGLTNMMLDNSVIHSFLRIDRSDRDPQYAYYAYNDFSELVHSYPNSKYITDATNHLILLKDRLAKHEYSIASYYALRGAWVAVVNRIKDMLQDYPNTKVTSDGLKLMENAYRQMQMNTQADKVAKIAAFSKKNT